MPSHPAKAQDKEFFDLAAEAKKRVNYRYDKYGEQAKAISDAGKLKLVSETICMPFRGYHFTLDKGQVIRYEMLDGPQILDIPATMSEAAQPKSGPIRTTRRSWGQ